MNGNFFILWIDGAPSKPTINSYKLDDLAQAAIDKNHDCYITEHDSKNQALAAIAEYENTPIPPAMLGFTASPNRFIKLSFTLSLLWVAKFYSVVDKACTSTANQNIYAAIYHSFSPLNLYLRITMPNTLDWLYN